MGHEGVVELLRFFQVGKDGVGFVGNRLRYAAVAAVAGVKGQADVFQGELDVIERAQGILNRGRMLRVPFQVFQRGAILFDGLGGGDDAANLVLKDRKALQALFGKVRTGDGGC